MKFNQYANIKESYLKRFPNDELGTEIKSNVTFNDLFNALDSYQCQKAMLLSMICLMLWIVINALINLLGWMIV